MSVEKLHGPIVMITAVMRKFWTLLYEAGPIQFALNVKKSANPFLISSIHQILTVKTNFIGHQLGQTNQTYCSTNALPLHRLPKPFKLPFHFLRVSLQFLTLFTAISVKDLTRLLAHGLTRSFRPKSIPQRGLQPVGTVRTSINSKATLRLQLR